MKTVHVYPVIRLNKYIVQEGFPLIRYKTTILYPRLSSKHFFKQYIATIVVPNYFLQ